VNSVDGFPYIEPSLNPDNETYLILVNDHFDVFLDLVCEIFIEYFCIDDHKGNWSEVLFLFVGSLYGFGMTIIVTS
jgi:hypothetical protein